MNIEELNQKLMDSNDIITRWKSSNDDINEFYLAVFETLEENRKNIIEYLKSKENN